MPWLTPPLPRAGRTVSPRSTSDRLLEVGATGRLRGGSGGAAALSAGMGKGVGGGWGAKGWPFWGANLGQARGVNRECGNPRRSKAEAQRGR